jgi:hypothetical protein
VDKRVSTSELPPGDGSLDRKLCQVGGRNQNYVSEAGTSYHIQVEDRGPIQDRTIEVEVRRVNLIVYANYGEPNARIVHALDYDFPDVRTAEYNAIITDRINEIVAEARALVEEREWREVGRIKELLREYYLTKDENAKREFEAANAQFPFLFSRAWRELKGDRGQNSAPVPEAPPPRVIPQPPPLTAKVATAPAPPSDPVAQDFLVIEDDVLYPMDVDLRQKVLEIERLIAQLGRDLQELRRQGNADDILIQTCRKLVSRAKETITGRDSEFNARRLEMTSNSLTTTWRQIRSRLKASS